MTEKERREAEMRSIMKMVQGEEKKEEPKAPEKKKTTRKTKGAK